MCFIVWLRSYIVVDIIFGHYWSCSLCYGAWALVHHCFEVYISRPRKIQFKALLIKFFMLWPNTFFPALVRCNPSLASSPSSK